LYGPITACRLKITDAVGLANLANNRPVASACYMSPVELAFGGPITVGDHTVRPRAVL
jgi:hypothetical protein